MDGGDNEVCICSSIIFLSLLVLAGQQGLFDSIGADLKLQEVVFDQVKHFFLSQLTILELSDPGFHGSAVFFEPGHHHFLNMGRGLLIVVDEVGQVSHDFIEDDLGDALIGSKPNIIPILLNEGGKYGCCVHLFRYQADACLRGILVFQDLFDDGNILTGERQDCNLFLLGKALVNVGTHLGGEDSRKFLMEIGQFVQLVIVERDFVREGLFSHLRQRICLKLNLCILIGFNISQSYVREVKNFLIATVVNIQLVSGKGV